MHNFQRAGWRQISNHSSQKLSNEKQEVGARENGWKHTSTHGEVSGTFDSFPKDTFEINCGLQKKKILCWSDTYDLRWKTINLVRNRADVLAEQCRANEQQLGDENPLVHRGEERITWISQVLRKTAGRGLPALRRRSCVCRRRSGTHAETSALQAYSKNPFQTWSLQWHHHLWKPEHVDEIPPSIRNSKLRSKSWMTLTVSVEMGQTNNLLSSNYLLMLVHLIL